MLAYRLSGKFRQLDRENPLVYFAPYLESGLPILAAVDAGEPTKAGISCWDSVPVLPFVFAPNSCNI